MKKRCDKCGGQLLELWNKEKTSIWIACAYCDKAELAKMRQLKREDDIDIVMGTGGK